ncbi:CDP-diacylglycerol--serine O-phosphatidyltransferase [Clostridium sp. MSJ-4]|uniref:CDP-diacylglycerol--serine O-phosphatidyltransferase n=1 Tax=Clostridium simiarum TaxID=2841506 RepID=A0ABS6EYT7_9CLOT|nr:MULTISPECIES: CDP-diacylglycerol--serine O-phosphatidyltransferase [Clostridium]MBU5591381.1 CDP-diacylglycerol--serine O-phosphatidyltransferase [Clostridium simiarum]
MKKSFLPNLFTFTNLGFGIMSLLMNFRGNYKMSCLFIIFAALVDRYDGKVARMLNVSSDLGKQLDSLSDLVSFGVAPSLLVYNMYNLSRLGILGYALLLLFPICGSYRLAKFNSMEFAGFFLGIPITAAGCIIALLGLLTLNSRDNFLLPIILLSILSYLMISNIKIKKV